MSIEERINELIIQMENRGFHYECDNADSVVFHDTNKQNKAFNDWDEVEEFVDNNPID